MKLLKVLSLNLLFLFQCLSPMEFAQPETYSNDGEKEVAEFGADSTSIVNMIRLNPKEALKVFCDAAKCGNDKVVRLFLAAQEDYGLNHTGLLVPAESGRPGLSMAEAFFRAAGIKKIWTTPTAYEYENIYPSNAYMKKLRKKQLPLKRAVFEENLDMIQLLVEHGADIHAVDDIYCESSRNEIYGFASKRDISALELAVKIGNPKTIDSILLTADQMPLPINDTLEKTVLYAARYNAMSTIEFLDLHAVDWNALMQKNTEALNEAARCHSQEVAGWLIEHVDINIVLQKAVWQGHREAVALLLNHGADCNSASRYGETLLMTAALAGDEKIVSLLLKAGALVNNQDSEGKTALIGLAAKKGALFGLDNRKKIAEILISFGADVNIANTEGKTAAIIAAERQDDELVAFLLGKNSGCYNLTSGQSIQVGAIKVEQCSANLFEWTRQKTADLLEQTIKSGKNYFSFY